MRTARDWSSDVCSSDLPITVMLRASLLEKQPSYF
jgi:hypothetical protein